MLRKTWVSLRDPGSVHYAPYEAVIIVKRPAGTSHGLPAAR